jgi:LmbE family N-acetylglucosaminyl deacetylase
VAARIGELFERYRPQVIITHNADDNLQHPDHVHAGRVTALAVEMTGSPAGGHYYIERSTHRAGRTYPPKPLSPSRMPDLLWFSTAPVEPDLLH